MSTAPDGRSALERLLKDALDPPAGRATDACLDAETMAAWMDGGLSAGARDAAQLHAADCGRCQALLAELVRLDAVAPSSPPVRATPRWLVWLAPFAAAAAGVAIRVAVPTRQTAPAPIAAGTVAERAAEEASRQPGLATPGPADRPSSVAATPNYDTAASPEPQRSVRRQEADLSKRESSASGTGFAADSVAAAPAQNTLLAGRQAETGVGATAQSDAEIRAKSASPPASAAPFAAPITRAMEAPAADARARAAAPFGAPSAPNAVESGRRLAGGIEIVSPDPLVRWRLAGASVQRSVDGGTTWEPSSTGVSSVLTAGAAPSASVCWLVGRGGVVLRSSDGRTWQRLAFPTMTDLSAVRATGAQAASVSTADGRTFDTADGGLTWSMR
ncbi:MAG: hypothetical protein ABUS56_11735 [Acidobacteriota bacterium]